ncbi:MAG: homocysteine S-methyltransferase family protein [Melioribacteraceae bacterium]|nr:homocysteine S-methyltransferase family protein [Melioribacteraceae bacterium]
MNNKSIIEFYNSIKKPFLLDGALGTFFQEKGFSPDKNLWFSYLNIIHPEIVEEVHNDYINAGADIITTNTFRTNPIAKKKSNLEITNSELVKKSVQLVKNLSQQKNIIIAGSNAPAEDCYQKERTVTKFDLEYNHKKHIELLYDSGVDIIWNETQSHFDEIEIISRFCSDNNIPFSINIFFNDNNKILSGESINDVIDILKSYNPDVIGFNCIKPDIFLNNIDKINLPSNWGFYFNCGLGDYKEEKIFCSINPTEYKKIVSPLFKLNPTFVGACCGSNPNHIKELRGLIDALH